ncbi:pol Retrovirus-related Pol polyprotein from transposon-like 10 [Homarus americanus]|uniref:Pol Retrovirus-related Pol polyprotein from transposon-like 10 n=1 Tax=Homarus americanus TaxID=6706 RepID=A0A8J5JQ42_HOMAM|nr:pol Retrovirus-related Pol polyprotein from transposon-like 10 [Homarus americanus]
MLSTVAQLTKKGQKFVWTTESQGSFNKLKDALACSLVLLYLDPTQPFILDCDASDDGIGWVLSRKKDDIKYVVAYYSKKLSHPERNYCVTRKELLAVVKSLDFFHPYLYGSNLTIRTDHTALWWLKTVKNPEGQVVKEDPAIAEEDQDLRPVVEWMSQSSVRPAWEMISGASPTTKNYWAQWNDAFWLTDETVSYVKSLQERLMEVHRVQGALEFTGEVMKRNHDVRANQVCYKDGDKVWQYNPLRKKGPWEGSYIVVERLSDVIYRITGRRKAQPKVVHVIRLWHYLGPEQYTWEDLEEQSPITDEDQTSDPGGTQGCTNPGNLTIDQEKEHCSLLRIPS